MSTAAGNDITAKIMNRAALAEAADKQRALGRKIGFTNGCFDLLHPGHLGIGHGCHDDQMMRGQRREHGEETLLDGCWFERREQHDEGARGVVVVDRDHRVDGVADDREVEGAGAPHGDAVGVMLPHVIRFNAQQPEIAAIYESYFDGDLADRVSELLWEAQMPRTITGDPPSERT